MPSRQSSTFTPRGADFLFDCKKIFCNFLARGVVYSQGKLGLRHGLLIAAECMLRENAKAAFDDAIDEDDNPELLSTDDLNMALAFAEGDCYHVKRLHVDKNKQNALKNFSTCLIILAPRYLWTDSGPVLPPDLAPDTLALPGALLTEPSAPGVTSDAPGMTVASPGTLISDKGGSIYAASPSKNRQERKGLSAAGGKAQTSRPRKPGKPSWIWGTKLTFFRRPERPVGEGVGVQRGGWDGHILYKGGEAVIPPMLSPMETASRQETHNKPARADSRDEQRLGQWYRAQFTSLLKDDKTAFGELFAGITEGLRAKPRRPRILQFLLETVLRDARQSASGSANRGAREAGGIIRAWRRPTVCGRRRNDCWSASFEASVKAWEASLADSPSRTPEEYNASLKTAAILLQRSATRFSSAMAVVCHCLLCGPIGENGGDVLKCGGGFLCATDKHRLTAYLSIHSGKTRDLLENDWPRHDPDGFTAAEASMVNFAHSVFTQAECDARKTRDQVPDGDAGAQAPGDSTSAHSTSAHPGAGRALGGSGPTPTGSTPAVSTSTTPMPTWDSRQASLSVDDFPAGVDASGGAGGNGTGASSAGAGCGRRGRRWSRRWTPMEQAVEAQAPASARGTVEDQAPASPRGGRADSGPGAEVDAVVQGLWQRSDRSRWSPELVKAHAVFRAPEGLSEVFHGRRASTRSSSLRRASGIRRSGPQISTENRPPAVSRWLQKGRKWDAKMDVGMRQGNGDGETHAALWVEVVGKKAAGGARSIRRYDGGSSLVGGGGEGDVAPGSNGMVLAVDDVAWALGPNAAAAAAERRGGRLTHILSCRREDDAGEKEKGKRKRKAVEQASAENELRRGRSAASTLRKRAGSPGDVKGYRRLNKLRSKYENIKEGGNGRPKPPKEGESDQPGKSGRKTGGDRLRGREQSGGLSTASEASKHKPSARFGSNREQSDIDGKRAAERGAEAISKRR
ncbi:hypothetical protein C8F04DRAFT_1193589 [Mycena alexandri]|uniref:Uncharacterized protein n=1 Tax=Mycena alexandri TaxID=1745969 RepID=A0AAD6SD94_9AGAR|nr:hypothetical protein C8F04DRAFT_1193589 [Mycena alexandri]